MKKLFLTFAIMIGTVGISFGQNVRAYVDKDGVPVYTMGDVKIISKRSRKRDKRRFERQVKKFNKLRYNVIKVLPYAREASKNLKVIEAELANIPDENAQKLYMKARESFLFGKYEKNIRNLSISQGKVLVKLIDRETGHTTYSLVQDLKSPTSAFFWQGIGRLFGYNLKQEYDAEEEFAIEVIISSIDSGQNPTYYDYLEARNQ